MEIADVFKTRDARPPHSEIIFATKTVNGQITATGNLSDQCFVLATGAADFPNGETASKLAVDTAIWGYKLVRLRPFYWRDKRRLLRRIFRSTNIAVWQKHREPGFEVGLGANLLVLINGPLKFWLGSVGSDRLYLWRDGKLTQINRPDTKLVGRERYGLVPQLNDGDFLVNDTLLFTSPVVVNAISENKISRELVSAGDSVVQLQRCLHNLLTIAEKQIPHPKSVQTLIAMLVKRIASRP